MEYPKGFWSLGKNVGIKDDTLDFGVVYSEVVCEAAAVFTKNNYPGSPIIIGREHIKGKQLQAVVVNSKNSNVATGQKGIEDSKNICIEIAHALNTKPEHVLPSSTGVIGVPLPIEKILNGCKTVQAELKLGNLEAFADAILTTDTVRKISHKIVQTSTGNGIIYGVAKGAGMIEPNMATMLSYIFTDIKVQTDDLQKLLQSSVDKSFNCISIDSDTSTSDTVALLCSGLSITVDEKTFQSALDEICIDLARQIVKDGEGATKLIELDIKKSKNEIQARRIGKSIINSPLIKTAIYGADPNWGRFVMAIGKVFEERIPYDSLEIFIGQIPVKGADSQTKQKLNQYLKNHSTISIEVILHTGNVDMRFWGCDFTEEYIKVNAYYTT